MKTIYWDCFCGISGDMAAAALLDAGADVAFVRACIDALQLSNVSVSAAKIDKRGISATQFKAHITAVDRPHHRHLPDIVEMITRADLPRQVASRAIAVFERLGRAEAEVHDLPIDHVHFHEVGAEDSIVDIVAANAALHQLEVEQVWASVLVTGSGTVSCDHGVMPVPAPATALILKGVPFAAGDVQAELVTPTGAALIREWTSHFGPMPLMRVNAIGYGAGQRDLADRANVVRVLAGDVRKMISAPECITIIETNIDDLNPELTATLIPHALALGARDAFLTPVMGKKGRPASKITVLCAPEITEAVATMLFEHGGTLGVRVREEARITLDRDWKKVATPWGEIPVKMGMLNGEPCHGAPEFEACRVVAEAHGIAVRRVYEAALSAAVRREFIHE